MNLNSPRILFISTLPPPVHGSAIVSKQIKDKISVCSEYRCDWVNLSTSRRVDEIGKTTLAKPFRLFSALLITIWKLISRRYDLCYLAITCHGIGFLKDVPFVLLCKIFCRRIIIHQHNKGMAKDVNRIPFKWLLHLCYKDVTVILLSWALYSDIEKIVPKNKVVICPNGIAFDSEYSVEKRIVNQTPHLLFLSNLMESKGVFILLDALKLLVDEGFDFICDIVGGETIQIDRSRLFNEIRNRKLEKNVVYHGRQYGTNKVNLFCKADIFVHPTYEDCFPLVLIEAMHYGLPCVTTDEGGIRDIVENGVNGFVCKTHSSIEVTQSLRKLLCDSELRNQMGEASRKRQEEFFSEDVFIQRIKNILNQEIMKEV